MAVFRALVLLAIGATASKIPSFSRRRYVEVAPADLPKYVLRICNAYPSPENLTVVRRSRRLEGFEPMQYKTCRDLNGIHLTDGDELEVDIGTISHTFQIGELPKRDAMLLLVVYRHLRSFMDMAFHSHIFEKIGDDSVQLAAIDTYDGTSSLTPRIAHDVGVKQSHGVGGSAELKFDSINEVNPGDYRIALQGKESDMESMKDIVEFVAVPNQTYIVLRIGALKAEGSHAFPEELLVFPHSQHQDLKEGNSLKNKIERELQRQAEPIVDKAEEVIKRAKQAVGFAEHAVAMLWQRPGSAGVS